MKEIICQVNNGVLTPHAPEDMETLKLNYKQFQLLRVKTYEIGAKKERSVTQLGLLHACFKLVADNAPTPQLNTPEKVKFACKVHTDFRDPEIVFVRLDGTVQFKYRSFAFAELDHMEACNVIERCFEYMAELLKISKEELIKEAKSRMLKHN